MNYGTCKYCGQIVQIRDADESWTEEELMRAASESCNCPESIFVQRIMKKKEDARETVGELFDEEITGLLSEAIDALGQNIKAVTITCADGTHGAISVTNKGNIKVTKKNSRSVSYEV